MARIATRDAGTGLSFAVGNRVSVPFTFSQTAFSVSFWYKQRTPIPGTVAAARQTVFAQQGGFSLAKQDANDFQIYAYLNAPTNFATPHRMRFGNFSFLGTTVSTPPYLIGRLGVLMLGSRVLLIPGIFVLTFGVTLQAGATGAVRAVRLSAALTAGVITQRFTDR